MSNENTYEQIREAIATGELRPLTRLVEADLCERYGATRPAVRVALIRLEQEGLIEQEKNRSARVRQVSPEEAIEIYQARALLESYAAGIAAGKITAEEIAYLETLIIQAETASVHDAVIPETAFHQKILDIAGHNTVIRLCGSLHGHLLRYHHYTKLVQDWADGSPCEHRQILEALRAGNQQQAESSMRSHLNRLTDILKQTLDSAAPSSR